MFKKKRKATKATQKDFETNQILTRQRVRSHNRSKKLNRMLLYAIIIVVILLAALMYAIFYI